MSRKTIPVVAVLLFAMLALTSCDLFAPDCALELAGPPDEPYYVEAGGVVTIHFRLHNIGDVTLSDCKVRWYVDDAGDAVPGTLEFDEITGWAPALGTTISPGNKSSWISVSTSEVDFSGGVEFFGVYAWGWENPPDEE